MSFAMVQFQLNFSTGLGKSLRGRLPCTMKMRLTWFLCTSLERWRLGYGLFEYIVSVELLGLEENTTQNIVIPIHFSRRVRRAQEASYPERIYDHDAGKDAPMLGSTRR